MKKNIAYLLFLVSFSCAASSPQQTISPQLQNAHLRNRSPKAASQDKENTEQQEGSPSKIKGKRQEVKDFLANQEMHETPQTKKSLFAALVMSGIYDGNL